MLAFIAVYQSPALAAADDARNDDVGNYARAPAPASAPEVPGFELPRENNLPDAAKLLGAPREVGASAPDDDTTSDAKRRNKSLFATTPPPRRHDVFPNPWRPVWPSTNTKPVYQNPW